MFISTTTLTSSPSDLTAVGQKQEACSSIGLLARQSPSDRPLTTPSSTTLSMAIRQPNWSEADTLLMLKAWRRSCAPAGTGKPASVRSLLAALKTVSEQVAKLDRLVIDRAKENAMCRHLMSIPGVGVLTALAFMTAIEDPAKFRKSRSVGVFLGLTPKRYQSGETDWDGRISKCGDALVRAYLYEAANALLTNCKKWSALKAWGMQLAKRRGLAKAKVAVARKLAVIMHQMWTTGEAFRWSSEAAKGKPTAA